MKSNPKKCPCDKITAMLDTIEKLSFLDPSSVPGCPDPGLGFRLLKIGEVIKRGDEKYMDGMWVLLITAVGHTYTGSCAIRRRISGQPLECCRVCLASPVLTPDGDGFRYVCSRKDCIKGPKRDFPDNAATSWNSLNHSIKS